MHLHIQRRGDTIKFPFLMDEEKLDKYLPGIECHNFVYVDFSI